MNMSKCPLEIFFYEVEFHIYIFMNWIHFLPSMTFLRFIKKGFDFLIRMLSKCSLHYYGSSRHITTVYSRWTLIFSGYLSHIASPFPDLSPFFSPQCVRGLRCNWKIEGNNNHNFLFFLSYVKNFFLYFCFYIWFVHPAAWYVRWKVLIWKRCENGNW